MGLGRVTGALSLLGWIGNYRDKTGYRAPGSPSLVEKANLARFRADTWFHPRLPFIDRPHSPFSCLPQGLRAWLGSLFSCCLVSSRRRLLSSQLRALPFSRRNQCSLRRDSRLGVGPV